MTLKNGWICSQIIWFFWECQRFFWFFHTNFTFSTWDL